jgi:hypothetical protein
MMNMYWTIWIQEKPEISMRLLKVFNEIELNTRLMIVLILANLNDFIATKYLIGVFGFDVELNPLLHLLLVMTGSVYVILLAKCVPLTVLWFFRRRMKAWVLWTLNIAIISIALYGTYGVYLTS